MDEPATEDISDYMGVDLGIVNIATTDDGERYSGTHVNQLRQKLQKKGRTKGSTKSAKRLLKKRSGRERRFVNDVNHCISKAIVKKARNPKGGRTGRGISLEDLTDIRKRVWLRKPHRSYAARTQLHSWSFADLGISAQQVDDTVNDLLADAIDLYWRYGSDNNEILDLLNRVLEVDPTHGEAYAYRGSIHRIAGDFEAASQDFETVLDFDPDNALLLSMQARLLYDQGDLKAAQKLAYHAVKLDDTQAEVFYNLARVLDDPELQIDNYTQAIAISPRATFYYHRGLVYKQLWLYSEALVDFTTVIELDPGYAWAYTAAGNIYNDHHMFKQALAFYNDGIVNNLTEASLFSNRGNVYTQLGQYEAAFADFERAIGLDPDFAGAYASRGIAYYAQGDHLKALDNLSLALELDPHDHNSYYNRAKVQTSLGDLSAALDDYSHAIDLYPRYHQAYLNRGVTQHDLGNYDKALDDFAAAIKIWPGFGLAYYNRGVTYSEMGRSEDAIADYLIARTLLPDYLNLYHNLGNQYYELGDYEQALENYNRAIELDPDDAVAYQGRAAIHDLLGNMSQANADRQRAAELGYGQ